jgi:hypothetical protein
MKNWLQKYTDGGYIGDGYTTEGRAYSPAWNGQFYNGGEIINVFNVGDAIAENGKEIQYYQQGRDWKPKSMYKGGNVQMKDQLHLLDNLTNFTNLNKKMEDGGSLYNINRAKQLGYTPDSIGHMPSRDYKTGLILKYPAHPTFQKGIDEDRKLGYRPMMDIFGNVYTESPKDIPTEGYFSPNKKKDEWINKYID